jgi:hypothetical protein
MLMAGKRRFMTENTHVLIHQLSTSYMYYHKTFSGASDDFHNDITFMNRLYKIYLTGTRYSYSPVPKKNILTKKILEEHMSHDIYWSYDTCFKYGLVDELYTNFKERDEVDLKIFLEKTQLEYKQPRINFKEDDFSPSDDIIEKVKLGKTYRNEMIDMISKELEDKKYIMEDEDDDVDDIVSEKFVKKRKSKKRQRDE